jgi:circadian clock protein KaiC
MAIRMSSVSDSVAPRRLGTGVAGLDEMLGGGLFPGCVYMIEGPPGSGKTILANQTCFAHVRDGGRAIYVTVLAETHAQMLRQISGFEFFEQAEVGRGVVYTNGFASIADEGLPGLLQFVRRAVRDQRATLLVLDGLVTSELQSQPESRFKRFIQDLQTWVGVIGCTVIMLASSSKEERRAEHTMVDGLIAMGTRDSGMRRVRHLLVSKFRGSAYLEGWHSYEILAPGLTVYPRLEVRFSEPPLFAGVVDKLTSGVPGLDELMGGGFGRGSTTLVLGSSGAGKTILGLQYLYEGAKRGERSLYFGFYEDAGMIVTKARRLGMSIDGSGSDGVSVLWQPPAERLLDALATRLIDAVRRDQVTRLFLDGLVGFKEAAIDEARVGPFFAVLSHRLSGLGVTTLVSDETRELFVRDIESATEGVSAICQNLLFLRQVERRAELLRLISVMKTRESGHSRALHEFAISEQGLQVVGRFAPGETVFTGVAAPGPRSAGAMADHQE